MDVCKLSKPKGVYEFSAPYWAKTVVYLKFNVHHIGHTITVLEPIYPTKCYLQIEFTELGLQFIVQMWCSK